MRLALGRLPIQAVQAQRPVLVFHRWLVHILSQVHVLLERQLILLKHWKLLELWAVLDAHLLEVYLISQEFLQDDIC